jgi:hypothetical protein
LRLITFFKWGRKWGRISTVEKVAAGKSLYFIGTAKRVEGGDTPIFFGAGTVELPVGPSRTALLGIPDHF